MHAGLVTVHDNDSIIRNKLLINLELSIANWSMWVYIQIEHGANFDIMYAPTTIYTHHVVLLLIMINTKLVIATYVTTSM